MSLFDRRGAHEGGPFTEGFHLNGYDNHKNKIPGFNLGVLFVLEDWLAGNIMSGWGCNSTSGFKTAGSALKSHFFRDGLSLGMGGSLRPACIILPSLHFIGSCFLSSQPVNKESSLPFWPTKTYLSGPRLNPWRPSSKPTHEHNRSLSYCSILVSALYIARLLCFWHFLMQ